MVFGSFLMLLLDVWPTNAWNFKHLVSQLVKLKIRIQIDDFVLVNSPSIDIC